jgi:DNA-directed RNA polymerase subunit RPC12/RpoP
MIDYRSYFCNQCKRQTLHIKSVFSGGMGCLLTIITGGLFLPIWLLLAFAQVFKPYRCQQCGSGKIR